LTMSLWVGQLLSSQELLLWLED